ncbi:MAG: hypothetical protein P8Y68_18000 [Anaerolineales bacterium]|jgi:hypothetical protein
MPRTNLGKWSFWLILVMFLLFVSGSYLPSTLYDSVQGGRTLLEDIGARPILAVAMLAGFGAGISAMVTGLVAIIKHKERTALVYGSTLFGVLMTFILFAEFLSPQ